MYISMKLISEYSALMYISIKLISEYSGVPLQCGLIQHIIVNSIALTEAEYNTEFETTKDTPYFALMGELWGVFGEDSSENWLRYTGITLYPMLSADSRFWLVNNREI